MKSGCIGCLATSVIQQKRTLDSSSSRLKTPWNPISVKSRCIGCLATIVVRGKRTSDSSSPHRFTPDSINTSHNSCRGRQCSFDPVTDRQTDKQTDKQTNFNFVRPSFQSREQSRFLLTYERNHQVTPSSERNSVQSLKGRCVSTSKSDAV